MHPGICYLYEYEKKQRKRNVGFIKVSRHYQSCIFQIHARGIPVGNGASLELYAFYLENGFLASSKIADLACYSRTVSMRFSVSETHFPGNHSLDGIDGFLIMLPGRNTSLYWIASENMLQADPSDMRSPEELNQPQDSEAEETAEPAPEEEELLPQDNGPEEAPAPGEEEFPSQDNGPEEAPAPGEEEFLPQDNGPEEAPAPGEEELLPQDSGLSSQDEGPQEREDDAGSKVTARKIQRSDLSQLPRRFWFLANNSFLLHGYHNYNHLLLVEEDGHMWLGVPGIYDRREARAADLFGFPQFTRSYVSLLDLTEDERNDEADFGHWCRYIDPADPK